ncbi:uncharacterized protein BDZ99DRAFT_568675 [Mytilinidion resinicola]|uniref:CHRD domain-containing protein n=1 Tax=Mytilinidion resinicola TaxID=574789 RepID=A0A6A6YYH0_9PEZI|nr:uncharacterized protein BDZ99DRAFT_568675 [Mytilinidion resinicola]KAF2813483.1 hypothetical protein BDZ99DRAFT_568675 [Mytilinidion resinicola]
MLRGVRFLRSSEDRCYWIFFPRFWSFATLSPQKSASPDYSARHIPTNLEQHPRNFGIFQYKDKHQKEVFEFTSTYNVIATPKQVVNYISVATGGLKGAIGYYSYGINSKDNVICYDITLKGFKGEQVLAYEYRLAFPNPMDDGPVRNSVGCLKGPFKTGVLVVGVDTADGFHIKQIEENAEAFFTDMHSSLAVPGTVRGQLSR